MSICKDTGTKIVYGDAYGGLRLSRCQVWKLIWMLAWHSLRHRHTGIKFF